MAKVTKTTLPSNIEAEATVLGSMLVSSQACSVGISSLSIDCFSDVEPRNKIIFSAMESLNKREEIIDVETVTDELINTNKLEAAGDTAYLMELMDKVINPDNIEHYIKLIKDKKVLREYLLKLQEIQKEYSEGKVDDIGNFITAAQQDLGAIANRRSVGEFRPGGEIARTVKNQIIEESKRSDRNLTGVDTGFRELNNYTHGWQKGDLIILAARPSVGKTAFALNLALNAAEHKKETVAIFSGEMSSELIMKRMLSSISRVSINMNTYLGQKELAQISSAVNEVEGLNLYIDDRPNPKLGDIIAKSIKLKNTNPDLCAIFIDYVNIIKTEKKFESRSLEIAEITSSLKELARDLKIPVIALAQINRNADSNENGIPSMSNLKDSGSIEQDADIIMLMYRKDYYNNQGKKMSKPQTEYEQKMAEAEERAKMSPSKYNTSITSINVTKNRNGQTGTFKLVFSKSIQRFDNFSEEAAEEERRLMGEDGYPSPDGE